MKNKTNSFQINFEEEMQNAKCLSYPITSEYHNIAVLRNIACLKTAMYDCIVK